MTARLVSCSGCPASSSPRLNNRGQEIDGLPEGWHGVSVTGTPQRSFTLCARCSRRLTMRLGITS